MEVAAAKLIGAGLAVIGMIGSGIGIGPVRPRLWMKKVSCDI